MGHSQNPRTSENQPEKGALDTDQDKSLEEAKTTKETEEAKEEAEETIEPTEPKEGEEEQPAPEEEAEGAEEAAPEEEEAPKEKVSEAEKEEVTPEKEEEIEKKEKREKAPEEEIVEERIYTIPLRRAWISPRKKRAPRAVNIVTSFIQRHMKVEAGTKAGDEEEEKGRLVISNEVNEKLWSRGIEKPPRNIRVRAVKDREGIVTLYLAEGD